MTNLKRLVKAKFVENVMDPQSKAKKRTEYNS